MSWLFMSLFYFPVLVVHYFIFIFWLFMHFIIGVGSPVEIGGCGAILIHVIRQYKYHLL